MSHSTPETRALAQKIKDKITSEPEHFDMNFWFDIRGLTSRQKIELNRAVDPLNVCGTTACLAGHAAYIGDGPVAWKKYWESDTGWGPSHPAQRATKLLGLTEEEASVVFHVSNEEALEYLDQIIAGTLVIED